MGILEKIYLSDFITIYSFIISLQDADIVPIHFIMIVIYTLWWDYNDIIIYNILRFLLNGIVCFV